MYGYTAEESLGQVQSMAEFLASRLQNVNCRTCNFGADPVTGQNQDFKIHFRN